MQRTISLLLAGCTLAALAGCGCAQDATSSISSAASDLGSSISSMLEDGEERLYQDGTYRAETEYDQEGWKEYVILEINKGKPLVSEYDAVNRAGQKRSEDEASAQLAEEQGGISHGEFYTRVRDLFNQDGELSDVAEIDGANRSVSVFKELVRALLDNNAKTGDTTTRVVQLSGITPGLSGTAGGSAVTGQSGAR